MKTPLYLSGTFLAPVTTTTLAGAFLLITITYLVYETFRQWYVAPGPPRLPILGNLLQIPSELQFIRYTKWAKIYGPIYSLDLPGQHVVVLNTYEAVSEFSETHSRICNHRPRLIMAHEILGGGLLLTLVRDKDVWRRMRRATQQSFNPRAVAQYQPVQDRVAVLAMLRVMAHPDEWERHLQSGIASATTSSVYGWPALDSKSHFIRHIQEFVAYISQAAVPGAYLVDAFPIMKHIPASLARWKREGLKWHEKESRLLAEYVDDIAEKNAAGSPQNGFVSGIMGSENQFGLSKKEITWLSATLFLAGTDTSSVVLTSCVLALLHYPDVMRKAQAELDAVVGQGQVPTFEGKDDLPYTQAVVREILRWRPPAPLGLPHATIEDSWFKGYFIPKGSFVLANVWAMNMDPSVYADPDVFRPERYLDSSGKLPTESTSGTYNGHNTFGFGRRICPGMHFAEQELFIAIAIMLWAFDIQPPVDEKGNVVLPSKEEWVDASIVVRPASFECKFSPRFPGVQGVLEASLSAVAG